MSLLKLGGDVYYDGGTKKFGIEVRVDDVASREEAMKLLEFFARAFADHVAAHGGSVEVVGKSPDLKRKIVCAS